jgi:dipeptide transport system permease protein
MGARTHDTWRRFARSRIAVAGLAVLLAVTLVAAFAELLAPYSPIQQHRDARLAPPAWQAGGTLRFPLGTDAVGRDVLSRLIHGSRYSLLSGLVVVTLALAAGATLGLVAGAVGGVTASVIVRAMDVILALPSLLLAIVVVVMLGDGLFNAMVAVAIVSLPHLVRLTRASVLGELAKDYVTATRAAGAGPIRLLVVTVLPNCLAPLMVQATLSFSSAILAAAALGFLGLGAQPPTPEWGTMLAEAREFVLRAWWVVTLPGLAILVTVLAVNVVGDGLRDALDPKLRFSRPGSA